MRDTVMSTENSELSTCPRRCSGCSAGIDFSHIEQCMPACMNCRREVEGSLTRVANRKLRKLRKLPECSVDKCATFLSKIQDPGMRFHLSSMAWWRLTADGNEHDIARIKNIMHACTARMPEFGIEYMHAVLHVLSPLSQEQLSAWFGHDNLYQIAELFSGGGQPEMHGKHCAKCRLYRMGCTAHNMLGADDCILWKDEYVQKLAAVVNKAGGWKDPCGQVDVS